MLNGGRFAAHFKFCTREVVSLVGLNGCTADGPPLGADGPPLGADGPPLGADGPPANFNICLWWVRSFNRGRSAPGARTVRQGSNG